MARIRSIKPGYFTSEELAEASMPARLLGVALLCQADREGRLKDSPRKIQHEAMPWDDIDVDALLNELARVGYLLRYEADGQRFIQILNFSKHQVPHIKEAASTIPAPFLHGASPNPPRGQHPQEQEGEQEQIQELISGAPSREGHDEASASPPEVREASPRAKAAASAMNNGSLQMNRQLEASRNAGAWQFDAVDLSLLRQAFEGLKGLPVAVNPADLPAEFGRRLARPKDDNDHAYDKLFALEAKEVAILCAESVAKGLACGNPRIEYVTGILRGALNAPPTKAGESLANVLTFPAASAAAPAPKPYVTAPWYAPWVLHLGAKFRNDGDLFSERLEAQRREDRSINYDEAMGIYRAKGFEAAMDFLWERRRIQETG